MKKIKKILLVLLILLVTGCSIGKDKLTEDYYTYINKDKISSYVLSDDEFTISAFTEVQDKVDEQVDLVLENALKTNNNHNMNILYNQLL